MLSDYILWSRLVEANVHRIQRSFADLSDQLTNRQEQESSQGAKVSLK